MYEHSSEPLLSQCFFYLRIMRQAGKALIVIIISLFIGVAGYHYLENIPWVDSLLNASMILGGMGPVDTLKTTPGKVFASFYALYSGLVLIGLTALMLAPVFHRVLHRFHEDRS
jgi:hypothetical protein